MPQNSKTAIVMMNTGSPTAPTPEALRDYLEAFLGDRRIIDLPRWKWWPILYGIVLRVRPKKSAKLYEHIWTQEGAPLMVNSHRIVKALEARLVGTPLEGVRVTMAMRYGSPNVTETFDALLSQGVERILCFPMFAQYCVHTSASCFDGVSEYALKALNMPALRFASDYYEDEGYIQAMKTQIESYWASHGRAIDRGGKLMLSFHSLPLKSIEKGDVYYGRTKVTAARLIEALGLNEDEVIVTYQSRYGRDPWLEPFSLDTAKRLAAQGLPSLDVFCPGFAADCLETLEEIAISLKAEFLSSAPVGTTPRFDYIPALNDSPAAIDAYYAIVSRELAGWVSNP